MHITTHNNKTSKIFLNEAKYKIKQYMNRNVSHFKVSNYTAIIARPHYKYN